MTKKNIWVHFFLSKVNSLLKLNYIFLVNWTSSCALQLPSTGIMVLTHWLITPIPLEVPLKGWRSFIRLKMCSAFNCRMVTIGILAKRTFPKKVGNNFRLGNTFAYLSRWSIRKRHTTKPSFMYTCTTNMNQDSRRWKSILTQANYLGIYIVTFSISKCGGLMFYGIW